jgi:copper chaperone NosL
MGLKSAIIGVHRGAAILVTVAMVLIAAGAWAGSGGPVPASTAPATDGRLNLSASDRCPVCAMVPARRPDAAAAMTLTSGETFYFCGNGCLLRAWLRPTAYLGIRRAAVDRLIVHDYFSGRPIDARGATWIAGSDVVGPMGPAIIALGEAGQLDTFKKRHGGKIVFTFDRIDDALWQRISGRGLPAAKTR